MAQDYLRMGIVRGQQANLPEPLQEEVDRTVLVVGGGVTGLTAALDAAAVGNDVVLIEKEARLGGWMTKWAKGIPHESALHRAPGPGHRRSGRGGGGQRENHGPHRGRHRENRRRAGTVRCDPEREWLGALPGGIHRPGHRVETLRSQQAGSSGIRNQRRRHHQRPDGRDAGLREGHPSQRRKGPRHASPSSSAPAPGTRTTSPTAPASAAGSPSNRPSWSGR